MVEISKTGYWVGEKNLPHGVDRNLARGILKFLVEELADNFDEDKLPFIILDVGCGTGFYTNLINKFFGKELIQCFGFDGNPNTPEISNNTCDVFDFTIPIPDSTQVKSPIIPFGNWVLSLEVGEHIPLEYEETFINNICWLALDGIILSWAVEGQGGDGHVNCRNNEYIISVLSSKDFDFDSEATNRLRSTASVYPNTGYWFRQSLMIFRRKK